MPDSLWLSLMTTSTSFPHAALLACLQAGQPVELTTTDGRRIESLEQRASLTELLQAAERLQASQLQIAQVADILRRDQKFARPGPPSPHLVRLRQQQAAARQVGNQARQGYVRAAQALVKAWSLNVPPRLAVETFVGEWMLRTLPRGDQHGV